LVGCTSVPVKIPTVMKKQYDVLGEGEGSVTTVKGTVIKYK
jgi:hypothetical protein